MRNITTQVVQINLPVMDKRKVEEKHIGNQVGKKSQTMMEWLNKTIPMLWSMTCEDMSSAESVWCEITEDFPEHLCRKGVYAMMCTVWLTNFKSMKEVQFTNTSDTWCMWSLPSALKDDFKYSPTCIFKTLEEMQANNTVIRRDDHISQFSTYVHFDVSLTAMQSSGIKIYTCSAKLE